MNIPHGPMDIVFYCCVITGAVAFIGTLGVAASEVSLYYPYGLYEYSYDVFAKVANSLLVGIIFPILFGILLIVFWFLGRPSSSMGIAWIFRILVIICCVAQLISIILCHAVSYLPTDADIKPNTKKMSDDKLQDFGEWLIKKYPQETERDPVQSAMSEWITDMAQTLTKLLYNFSVFLGFTLVFDTLVAVYWSGNQFFGASSSSAPKDSAPPKSTSNDSAPAQEGNHEEV